MSYGKTYATCGLRGGAWAVAKPLTLYVALRADKGQGLSPGRGLLIPGLPVGGVSGRGGAALAGAIALGGNGSGLERRMGVLQLVF